MDLELIPRDAGTLVTLVGVIGAGLLALVGYVVRPREHGRGTAALLDGLGIRGRAALGEWQVPVSSAEFKSEFTQALPAVSPPVTAVDNEEQPLVLPGNPRRFLNPNRVNPLDFEQVKFEVRAISSSESRVACRVVPGGYWRLVAIICALTALVALSIAPGRLFSGHSDQFWRILGLILAFDIWFLVVRYIGQRETTHNYLDHLVMKVVQRLRSIPPRTAG